MKGNIRSLIPVIIFFIVLNAFFLIWRGRLEGWDADVDVLVLGNLILFIITVISFLMGLNGLKQTNPNAFVRSVYGGIMVKLFICIIAAFVYIAIHKSNVNKPALFICMGLYLVYTFIEVSILMKMLRQRSNG